MAFEPVWVLNAFQTTEKQERMEDACALTRTPIAGIDVVVGKLGRTPWQGMNMMRIQVIDTV